MSTGILINNYNYNVVGMKKAELDLYLGHQPKTKNVMVNLSSSFQKIIFYVH